MRKYVALSSLIFCFYVLVTACAHQETMVEDGPFKVEITLPLTVEAQEVLPEVWMMYARGKIFSAEQTLNAYLKLHPTHLESLCLLAFMYEETGDTGAAGAAWMDVESVVVYSGKVRPFILQAPLYAAARHYLIAGREQRARIFLGELWRRFPSSPWSQRAQLVVAEAAVNQRRWVRAANTCRDLLRLGGEKQPAERCQYIIRVADRMVHLGPNPAPGAPRWSWVHPTPQGNDLKDIWATGEGELFAVGTKGTLLHRAAGERTFTLQRSPTRWALNSVHGSGRDNIYAAGDAGVVIHFDGKIWKVVRPAGPIQSNLTGIFTAGPGHAAAVSSNGTVVSLAKKGWTTARPSNEPLFGIWGSDRDNLLAVGKGGILMRFSAGSWETINSDTYEDLWAIWGSGAKNAVAVGNRKTVVDYNGKEATESVAGLTGFRDVWGFGTEDTWAVGLRGNIIYRWRKRDWVNQPTGLGLALNGVAGGSPRRMVAVGQAGTLVTWRGKRWKVIAGGRREALVALTPGLDGAGAMALGSLGTLMELRKNKWRRDKLPGRGQYTALWCDGETAVAVGHQGLLVVYRDGEWKVFKRATSETLLDVIGQGKTVVAVGTRGTVLRLTGDKVTLDPPPTGHDLKGVWADSPRSLIAVGTRGRVLRWSGGAWQEQELDLGVLDNLNAVRGHNGTLVAVGRAGTILQLKAGRWTRAKTPTSQNLVSLWGDGKDRLFAVSAEGGILRLKGKTWTVDDSPAACLRAIHGNKNDGVYAVGCNQGILKLNE